MGPLLPPPDYLGEASDKSRLAFAQDHPYFFPIDTFHAPAHIDHGDEIANEETTRTSRPDLPPRGSRRLIFAVRKVQTTFPSMITVGRTHNNDIVIANSEVSRFHAYFRVLSDRVELGDAGSANGTFIDGKRLPSKGPVQIVVPGERVRFAHYEFLFVDADSAWERLHRL